MTRRTADDKTNHTKPSERRGAARTETDQRGSVRLRNVSYSVEVCDVSTNGAQIRVRQGLMPAIGQTVTLQFMNHGGVEARVIWVRDTLAGLEFCAPLNNCIDELHFEDLGSDYFRAILKLQHLSR